MAKFQDYLRIDEITKLKDRDALKIIMSEFEKVFNSLEKTGWKPIRGLFGSLLNHFYDKFNLSFSLAPPDEGDIGKQAGQDWFVDAALLTDSSIVIFVNPDVEKEFEKFEKIEDKSKRKEAFKKSGFVREFQEILSHELVHKEQWVKSGEKLFSKRYTENMPVRRYLSFPHEIEAKAHDAATKLHRGDPAPEIEIYQIFGKKHSVFKRFMKKLEQYKQELRKRG